MKRFVWLIVSVVVVIGLWSAGWLFAAGYIRSQLAILAQGDGESTPKITCQSLDVGGFPFRFDVGCTGATIVDGDTTVTVGGVRASVLVYNPTHVIASALAPITFADAFSGSQSRIDFKGAEASLRLTSADFLRGLGGEGWRIARASLVADEVALVNTVTGDLQVVSAGHLELHAVDIPEQFDRDKALAALALYAQADAVNAPDFKIADGRLSLEGELSGLPADLRDLAGPDALPRIQAAGGRLQLTSLKAETASEFFSATGDIGLDAQHRPEGKLQFQHKGIIERFGELIPPDLKGWVLGPQAADGSYSQTLTLRAGFAFSGLVPVGMLPPLF